MARGFVYLAVVLDWFSRRVLSWRLSITMEAAFCVETLEDALACHGKPEIFNTDQGSQFTGAAFTGVLIKNGIAISMDGKGAWRDNIFVSGCGAASNTRRCICGATTASRGLRFTRPIPHFLQRSEAHSGLDGKTPRSSLLHPAATPLGSLTPAEAPLIDAEKLFRQPGPPQTSGPCSGFSPAALSAAHNRGV